MSAPFLGPDVKDLGSAWIDPSARLFGLVEIGEEASVWCNVVVRAESQRVVIGRRANIQDFVMIHVGAGTPTMVGANCSITHHVTLHGCDIGDDCLIGIGATIMDGCVVGAGSIVAGGTFLKEGTIIPPNSIVMGSPGAGHQEPRQHPRQPDERLPLLAQRPGLCARRPSAVVEGELSRGDDGRAGAPDGGSLEAGRNRSKAARPRSPGRAGN